MEFQCKNELCNGKGEPVTFLKVELKFKGSVLTFWHKGKQISCPKCNEPLEEIKGIGGGFGCNYGSFSTKSPQEKREILKKRNAAHRDTEAIQRKEAIENGEIKQ